MSTRNSAEHRATYQSHSDDDDSAQLEHAVEDKLDHKTQHRVEVNGDSKSNEFLTKFNSELRGDATTRNPVKSGSSIASARASSS